MAARHSRLIQARREDGGRKCGKRDVVCAHAPKPLYTLLLYPTFQLQLRKATFFSRLENSQQKKKKSGGERGGG